MVPNPKQSQRPLVAPKQTTTGRHERIKTMVRLTTNACAENTVKASGRPMTQRQTVSRHESERKAKRIESEETIASNMLSQPTNQSCLTQRGPEAVQGLEGRRLTFDFSYYSPSLIRTQPANTYRNLSINSMMRESFYKASDNVDGQKTINDLKRQTNDLLQRSVKAFDGLRDGKEVDASELQYASLSSVKNSLYTKKALKYEYNKELRLSSAMTKVKSSQLLEKLRNHDLHFEKLSQAYCSNKKRGLRGQSVSSQQSEPMVAQMVSGATFDNEGKYPLPRDGGLVESLVVSDKQTPSCVTQNDTKVSSVRALLKSAVHEPYLTKLVSTVEKMFKSRAIANLKQIKIPLLNLLPSKTMTSTIDTRADTQCSTGRKGEKVQELLSSDRQFDFGVLKPAKLILNRIDAKDGPKSLRDMMASHKLQQRDKIYVFDGLFKRKNNEEKRKVAFRDMYGSNDK